MKILLVGDTHGNGGFVRTAVKRYAEVSEADVIFQLGDFGFTFHEHFIECVQDVGLPWYWLDGNHDNHDFLSEPKRDADGNVIDLPPFSDPSRFHEIWPNIFYSARGHAWEWDGVHFLTCGGAFSIDRAYRTQHVSWWPQELITDAEVDRCVSQGKVDIVLSHDAPAGVDPLEAMLEATGYKVGVESRLNREQMTKIIQACQPSHLYHGHYHFAYTGTADNGNGGLVKVRGLDCDGSGGQAFYLLDTEVFRKERDVSATDGPGAEEVPEDSQVD